MSSDLPSQKADQPATLATTIYARLKADILTTRLEPGRKLQSRFLMEQYNVGQTPLREALNRLTTEEFVVGMEQRGFYVKEVSREELQELTKTKCWVEGLALRESMQNATQAWEESLLVAHHRLERTPRSLKADTFEDNPDWEKVHRAFHATLIGLCGSRPLLGFCEQLADRLYRYRMMSIAKAYPARKVGAEHREILQAVLAKDIEEAVRLLQQHYQRTADVIYSDLDGVIG
ncbi:GntR family transcriptional regulator [Bradyrhizobium manausense]|uniref:GntR family transcriptional regulator n=1 Tax=Bradyrhizobium TaxID=374 RepID=UPI001BAD5D0D|nr:MULTISPECIES: GntR family transcriptional regulator [Bradyrhizobium]MBR0825328.1 GntR family transcriptional regulator [Bradyrhizobium manausense]UVO28510.1 GntR family transcriptional regulator [Bradyrhizobium arachidis]